MTFIHISSSNPSSSVSPSSFSAISSRSPPPNPDVEDIDPSRANEVCCTLSLDQLLQSLTQAPLSSPEAQTPPLEPVTLSVLSPSDAALFAREPEISPSRSTIRILHSRPSQGMTANSELSSADTDSCPKSADARRQAPAGLPRRPMCPRPVLGVEPQGGVSRARGVLLRVVPRRALSAQLEIVGEYMPSREEVLEVSSPHSRFRAPTLLGASSGSSCHVKSLPGVFRDGQTAVLTQSCVDKR